MCITLEYCDLPTAKLKPGGSVQWTFYWLTDQPLGGRRQFSRRHLRMITKLTYCRTLASGFDIGRVSA